MRNLQTVILDEAGVMLTICFAEVSKIVEAVHEADAERKTPLQKLLFSATVPAGSRRLRTNTSGLTRW